MLIINKEYLVHNHKSQDRCELPLGLVYNYKDIMQLFKVSHTVAYRVLQDIIAGVPFVVRGVMYDSVEIKGGLK